MSDTNSRPTPDVLDQATGALRDTPVPAGPPADLTAATVAAVHNRLADRPSADRARHERRRRIMRYVGYGSAAAAVAGIATLAGVLWFGGSSAAAKVRRAIDAADQAKTVRIIERRGDERVRTTYYRDRGKKIRSEEPGKVVVQDLKSLKGVELDPSAKTARRFDLDEEAARDEAEEFVHSADPLSIIRGIKDSTVKELPGEKIGTRPAKVYEIGHPGSDPKFAPMKATLWVDEKTGLPVRMLHHQDPADQTIEFEAWNEEFDASLFSLDVPAGYKLVDGAGSQIGPGGESFVLFTRAIENVEKATSMRAVAHLDAGNGEKIDAKLFLQGDLVRAEAAAPGMVVVMNLKGKTGLLLFTKPKTAVRLDFEKNEIVRSVAAQVGRANRGFIRMKSEKVAALRDEALDGRMTKVGEMKGMKLEDGMGEADGKVWIDPKALLPVRVQVKTRQGKESISIILDVLGWNEDLDPKLFEMTVPEGFKVVEETGKE